MANLLNTTISGSLNIGDGSADTRLIIKRLDSTVADDIQFYNGTTRVGEIGTQDTTWLRINQNTVKNIYTPRYIRADGGFFVDGTAKGINGSGNFIGGTITNASDANVSNWDTAYGWGNHASAGYLTGVTNISGYSGALLREDNRTISPSELTAGQMKFGFTSYGNNNSSPYADFIHFRSYTDSSGGADNLVMFKKSGIGMRIWQQTFGSSTAYSSYVDVLTSAGGTLTGNLQLTDPTTAGTSSKIQFGTSTSWNNNIGIESYWMVFGCNQNEGFKFEDSTGNMLLQLNGGNSSSGNGQLSATFAGDITFGDSHFIGDDASDNLLIQSSANENIIINSLDDLLFRTSGTTQLQINSTTATFSGNVNLGNNNITNVNSLGFDDGISLFGGGAANYLHFKSNNTGAGGIEFFDGEDVRQGYLYYDGDNNTPSFGLLDASGTWAVRIVKDGLVELRYDNAIKLQTTSTGIDILDGNIAVDSSKGFNNSGSWTRNQTPYGYIEFGPANASWAHIYTDRANFYFNKNLYVNNNLVWNAGNFTPSAYLPLAGGTMTGGLTGTTASFSGKVDFQGDAAIEGGTGYGVFKGYSTNANHFIAVRGVVANQNSLSITGGHQTTFVEHANGAAEGWYFKSNTTGSYREIARIDGLNNMYLGGNTVWNAGNDGSGSGLDADLLDGVHKPTNFSATSQTYTTIATGQWDLPTGSSMFSKSDSVGGPGQIGYWYVTGRRNISGGYGGIYSSYSSGNHWFGYNGSGTSNPTWDKIWTDKTFTPGDYLPLAGGVMSGNIERSAHNSGFLVGGYNNVGNNSASTNPIFTIGTNYLPAATTLGSMYGIGYSHPNASFISLTGANGWGMYVAAGGTARVWLDGGSGNISHAGSLYTAGSGNFVGTVSAPVFSGNITSSGDGQSNYPFRLGADYNSYMMTVASNTWGLFWAGSNGARYGTNGNGGPGNIWSNSTNPNEFAFVGSDSTAWTVHGSTGNTWQKGDLYVGGGDIVLSGTGRIQGIDTVSASTDAANKSYVDFTDRSYITDSRGSVRAPSYYDDRYAQWDFQNVSDTGVGGDGWHALLTVSKWSSFDASHRQEQLIFSGEHLWRRTASSDSAWGTSKKILDSSNYSSYALPLSGGTMSGAISFGTSNANINMSRGGFITFYEDSNSNHSIGSRNNTGAEADDIRINSYGAVYVNLDSNSNNTSGADFVIGRHGGGTSTISDLFKVDGENGNITTSGVSAGGGTISGGNIVFSGTVGGNASQSRDKLRVWNGYHYSIGMMNAYTFGSLGNDYAMSFQMNDSSSRGFWWGDVGHSNAQGAMSLTTDGRLYVAKNITVGQGEAYTTDAIQSSFLNVYGDSATIPAATVYQSNVNGDGLFVNMDSNASVDYVLRLQADGGSEDVLYARANGQIGIGTESPNGRLNIIKPGLGGFEFHPENSTDTNLLMHFDRLANADMNIQTRAATHQFLIGPTEKMRLDASGHLIVYSLGSSTVAASDVRYHTGSKEIFYQTSSKRYKTDIINLESSLDKINALRPVRYKNIDTQEVSCGLIAEETVKIIPEVVFTKEIEGFSEPQVEGINYSDIVPFLIKSIQELKAEIELLKSNQN